MWDTALCQTMLMDRCNADSAGSTRPLSPHVHHLTPSGTVLYSMFRFNAKEPVASTARGLADRWHWCSTRRQTLHTQQDDAGTAGWFAELGRSQAGQGAVSESG